MYQLRSTCIVQYGKFRDFSEAIKQLSEVCSAKGWATPRFLGATTGSNNEAVLEFEYPDMATLQAETHKQNTDPDFMKAWRLSEQCVYPQSARTEIYEDAFDIA